MQYQPPDRNSNKRYYFNDAYRLGMEFTSGVLVGVFIGYFVDRWLQTSPWGMVVFILLGAAAGFLNIYRLIETMKQENYTRKNKKND